MFRFPIFPFQLVLFWRYQHAPYHGPSCPYVVHQHHLGCYGKGQCDVRSSSSPGILMPSVTGSRKVQLLDRSPSDSQALWTCILVLHSRHCSHYSPVNACRASRLANYILGRHVPSRVRHGFLFIEDPGLIRICSIVAGGHLLFPVSHVVERFPEHLSDPLLFRLS